jgi:hypothetical protein
MPSPAAAVLLALRRHWLVLSLVLLYLLRWAQYAVEAAAYRARPAPGDALGWLLLGQFYLAIALVVGLLAGAGWRRAHWRFYLALAGVVVLPFVVQWWLES